ncbi:MAG TPA: mannose-1-phosphate guanylyltransferase/mannose-6-phosphate isomerase [Sulfuricaulis sp.]|jgi:mannose-1-phosphate guanylyltransferase/mannose-6-phosphate isomerase|nr:mannose-1-phosphate guanylyltransferase/mannose-6-phosphate isomerase [Sulfuricaulis sp.]
MKIFPVILSGGSGTRLWPLSREHYPKQLLPLLGDQTLLQQTVLRLDGMEDVAPPLLVCNEEHRFLIAEQLRQIGKTPADMILEPVGRNTAPALTLAVLALLKHATNNNVLMLIMPADHVIRNVKEFHAAVREGAALAQKGSLVTFGIVPTAAETGYGYIKKGDGHRVSAFVEKPDLETASRYISSGDYFWNSGMFMMLASVWMAELKKFQPAILEACKSAFDQGRRDSDFYRVNSRIFGNCQSKSIDYAVMEATDKAAIVALDAGWSDIGAWSSLLQASKRDDQGNFVQGDTYLQNTRNSLLISQHRLLAAVGLDEIIVVETSDAVLVAHKSHAQDVKEVVNRLKTEKRSEYQSHRRVYRPWGYYESVDAGQRFQVKRLMVKPGASLSLQMHHHRAEHWVVVKGTARVTRGEEVFMLTENQSTYIPLGTKHRLENPGNIPLEIVEVQSGGYLGEDDIVRFEDKYNRTT